ncbi:LOW QUALITY PROTEIN: C-type lectin domain family 2 member B-like [Chroicocephalus ridibundus]|uniref:LOW QUALITY PROTEIN: C-type lectin domain family 2 member B-like n=1 Tax=Chroicocephalus ridibundus TaxID=1192867 RepID=UPI002FDCC9B9
MAVAVPGEGVEKLQLSVCGRGVWGVPPVFPGQVVLGVVGLGGGQHCPHPEWLFPPPGRCPTLHPVWVVVLAVLVALVLALAVALAVRSAGRHGGDPAVPAAPMLACPEDWVGYRNVCYSFSRAEGSWEWSQEQCSLHGASLAMPRREWEMEFLLRLKGNMDYWLGLRRRGERLQWVDGSSFNQRFEVQGQGECAYLYDGAVASAGCSQSRLYICSKPQALG